MNNLPKAVYSAVVSRTAEIRTVLRNTLEMFCV